MGPGEMWDVADDGTMVGDSYLPHPDYPDPVNQAAYYRIGEGWTAIGGVPGIIPWDPMWFSHAKGIARETGDKIVGMAWINAGDVVAYEYDITNSLWTTLQAGDEDGESYKAIGVSGDGSIVVGWDQQSNGCRTAFSWTPDPTWLGTMYTTDPNWPHGEADAVSDNGTYIVGGGLTDSLDFWGANVTNAFRWTEEGGMVPLGLIEGHEYLSWGNAVTNDGDVFGYSMSEFGPWGERAAFWWTEEGGMVRLSDALTDMGAVIPEGYALQNVMDVSSDGRFIVGFAQDLMWNTIGFVAEVDFGTPAPATLTLTPVVDFVGPDGGDIVYDAHLLSTIGATMPGLRYQTFVTMPDGTPAPINPVDDIPFTHTPFMDVTVLGMTLTVPVIAPIGDYWLEAIAGVPGNPALQASDSFMFVKTFFAGGADGGDEWVGNGSFIAGEETNVAALPSEYRMGDVYPNPFNPTTTITLSLPAASELNLRVVNLLGQEVASLMDGQISAGNHSFVFDGANLSSGVYFVHAVVPGELNAIQKVILMK